MASTDVAHSTNRSTIPTLLLSLVLVSPSSAQQESTPAGSSVEQSIESPRRTLNTEEKARAEMLEQSIRQRLDQGLVADALPFAEQLYATRVQLQGEDHGETIDARFAVQLLRPTGPAVSMKRPRASGAWDA